MDSAERDEGTALDAWGKATEREDEALFSLDAATGRLYCDCLAARRYAGDRRDVVLSVGFLRRFAISDGLTRALWRSRPSG